MMWCFHKWTEIERTYNPPAYGATVENASDNVIQSVAFGITNITQKCNKCGRTEVSTAIGKV